MPIKNTFADGKVMNWASILGENTKKQAEMMATLPVIFKHIALMPDAHLGKGAVVGSVIATKGAIIPSAVGVDIGCGMACVKLPFNVEAFRGEYARLRASIERGIPTGRHAHKEVSDSARENMERLGCDIALPNLLEKAALQLGTLGGGNHFIEICVDNNGGAWLMLHSGSRNIGKELAEIHIENAKGLMKKYFVELPDPDLAYLVHKTAEYDNYIHDMLWAAEYALANRDSMLDIALRQISYCVYGEYRDLRSQSECVVNCHHNYTQMENHFGQNVWITRKGAISARKGQLGIIPGSMGAKSYIVRGLGNPASYNSCSHGAGRLMSRTEARNTFTLDDLATQTAGVECPKSEGILDEIPAAYKPIEQVMLDQEDLVEILYELKQVICIKGV